MDQYSEADVRIALEPFHTRIRNVIERGFNEWLVLTKCMSEHGFDPILYSRTLSNYVFDAIARNAIRDFGKDSAVRVKEETQTVKFCFGGVVIARFKRGDDDNLGQNQLTQAVLDFIDAQQVLPGFPPEAAKVEFVWKLSILEDSIDEISVVARDGDRVLWSYAIDKPIDRSGIIDLPRAPDPGDGGDDDRLVVPKNDSGTEAESD